jgi:threonine aldolase
VEYTGHKVLSIPHKNGKLPADALDAYLKKFYGDESCEHMVYPGMVYISHPTEYGTLYSKDELENLSCICRQHGLTLFMDGARLGFGLMSDETDVTLEDIAKLCDVFYIGGTKMGALCGEAVVFTKNNTPKHFVNIIKKHGALLAKGRLTSVQFDTLFTDGLYFEIGKHGIRMAQKLKNVFEKKGYRFFMDSPTNQQFIILPNKQMEQLKEKVAFSFWEEYDQEHTVVRFATGWSTTEDEINYLDSLL